MSDPRPGAVFMFGIPSKRADRETIRLFKETGASGVLLLARNIESPAQVRRLAAELVERVGRRLLFAVDHEGGWVLRFSRGPTAFPGNAALGRAGEPTLAYAVGRQMALELGPMGIGLNLAPVLDVVGKRYNPGIGIRSFGRDPETVGRLGAAFIRGLQDHGVSGCAKHFPGKGAATVDAHVTLPTIRLDPREFHEKHLAPFVAAAAAGVDCVMTSHARIPALDPEGLPATLSARITRSLLRGRLGFKGAVLSDDLCMGAVTERMPLQQAAVRALEAGHDLLLIAHDPAAQRESAELLERALEDGLLPEKTLRDSARRIGGLLDRSAGARGPRKPPDRADGLARRIAEAAVEQVRTGTLRLPLELGPEGVRTLAIAWPDFREVADRFTFEGGPEGPLRRLRARVSRWPARTAVLDAPVLRGGGRIPGIVERARRADAAVFFCFEALRFPGQAELLERLQREMPERLAVCLIRNPWDRSRIKPGVTALDGYGYRDCSIAALLDAIYPA